MDLSGQMEVISQSQKENNSISPRDYTESIRNMSNFDNTVRNGIRNSEFSD